MPITDVELIPHKSVYAIKRNKPLRGCLLLQRMNRIDRICFFYDGAYIFVSLFFANILYTYARAHTRTHTYVKKIQHIWKSYQLPVLLEAITLPYATNIELVFTVCIKSFLLYVRFYFILLKENLKRFLDNV